MTGGSDATMRSLRSPALAPQRRSGDFVVSRGMPLQRQGKKVAGRRCGVRPGSAATASWREIRQSKARLDVGPSAVRQGEHRLSGPSAAMRRHRHQGAPRAQMSAPPVPERTRRPATFVLVATAKRARKRLRKYGTRCIPNPKGHRSPVDSGIWSQRLPIRRREAPHAPWPPNKERRQAC